MNVNPQLFVACMEEKWREYGNVVSDPLRAVWTEIGECMNRQIRWPTLPRPVIPAELGAGKSTSAKLYSTLWAHGGRDEHPGILIVVRTTEQAEEYARDINEWSRENTALAWHTKLKPRPSREEIEQFPTVVICHRQYELALDEHMVDANERLDKFTQFYGGARRLVIVDEALEQVHVARLPQRVLRKIRDLAPPLLVKRHKAAFRLLDSVDHALMDAPAHQNAVIDADALLAGTSMTVAGADLAIQHLWNALGEHIHDLDNRTMVREALTALRRQIACYRWTESEQGRTELVSSRLLLPPDAGQVFLDATGSLNSVYIERPDQFSIRRLPQVRDYSSARYYYAWAKRTGKWAMKKEGEKIAAQMLDAVLVHYGERASERRVLVVTDKDSEGKVAQVWATGPFAELNTAHWEAIDGRNCWRDFDTLVMISTPWGPKTLDMAHWFAIADIEPDDGELNVETEGVLRVRGQRITSKKAQAIGRLRLRRMIDTQGGCEPVDVFDRLPHAWAVNSLDPQQVLAGIRQTLRGIQTIEWAPMSEAQSTAGRRPRTRDGLASNLLAMAREMKSGERQRLEQATFGGSNGSFYRMVENAQKQEHELYRTLAEVGAYVRPGGYRDGLRRAPSELIKK
jgi:hypothetical protein